MSFRGATRSLFLPVAVLSLTGCGGLAFIPAGSPIGVVQSTSTARAVASSAIGAKKGEACAMSILQLVTLGDASISTAAKNGGISQISVVDNDDLNVFGIYSKHCSEVSGN